MTAIIEKKRRVKLKWKRKSISNLHVNDEVEPILELMKLEMGTLVIDVLLKVLVKAFGILLANVAVVRVTLVDDV